MQRAARERLAQHLRLQHWRARQRQYPQRPQLHHGVVAARRERAHLSDPRLRVPAALDARDWQGGRALGGEDLHHEL